MKLKQINNWETRMTLTDLCDTDFEFNCECATDELDYFDYTLNATVNDYVYYQSLNVCDVKNLRMNCERILQATDGILKNGY